MSLAWPNVLRPLLFLLLTLALVWFGSELVATLPARPSPRWLASGLTLDLVLGIPLLYWWLLVRGAGWPRRTLLGVFVLSVLLASQLIPRDQSPVLQILHGLLIPLEALVLGFVTFKAIQAVRLARQRMHDDTDLGHALRDTARELLGPTRLADLAAFEVALPYYAFLARRAPLDDRRFSIDREVGYGGIFGLLMMAIAVEVFVVHMVVVSLGGTVAAWVLTALGIYGGIWLVADYRAIRHRPFVLGEQAVTLRVGFRWQVRVPYELIDHIGPAPRTRADKDQLNLCVFGDPQLVLQLRQPVQVEGLYGVRRSVSRLGLRVDRQTDFVAGLQARCDRLR